MGRLVKSVGRVVPSEVLGARAQANAIVEAARAEAAALVGSAAAEADGIRAHARAEGEAAGRAAAEAAFTTLLLEARADAERVRSEAAPSAQALAMRMAEKIVARVVDLDPGALTAIVAEALTAARARTGLISLRVHPDQLSALESARPELMARVGGAVELRFVADAAVERIGCIVETPAGRLDAQLETQLAVLEQAIFGVSPSMPGIRS